MAPRPWGGGGPAPHARSQLAASCSMLSAGMEAAAASGAPREEEGPGGEAA
ncbi:Hypothetical predicted protein, partial [Marmota monax]